MLLLCSARKRGQVSEMKKNNPNVHLGGQAVIEGVMMRNRSAVAIALNKGEGSIVVRQKDFQSLGERYPILKWPLLRGMLAFVEALILGFRSLSTSAEEVLEEEEEELKGWELPLTLVISLAAGIGLFILLPTVLMNFLRQNVEAPFLLNLGEGGIRLGLFLGYVYLISRWGEVSRVFEYHGAEHRAIACYESGVPLTVENARRFSTQHRRCGTSFLLIVMVTSILLFSFFGWPGVWQRILLRLSLLPLVAGISYEAIRFAGLKDNFLTRLISQPGLWLQKLTTRVPGDEQMEVALRALKAVLPTEEEHSPAGDSRAAEEPVEGGEQVAECGIN